MTGLRLCLRVYFETLTLSKDIICHLFNTLASELCTSQQSLRYLSRDYFRLGLVLCRILPGPGNFIAHRGDRSLTEVSGPITQWQERGALRLDPQSERRMAQEVSEAPGSRHTLLPSSLPSPTLSLNLELGWEPVSLSEPLVSVHTAPGAQARHGLIVGAWT